MGLVRMGGQIDIGEGNRSHVRFTLTLQSESDQDLALIDSRHGYAPSRDTTPTPTRRKRHHHTTTPLASMPHVEVLPNSTAAVAPGWTYVVDSGYDPSKVAINPRNKKRAAAAPSGARGENDLSARQQTAMARRIAELERDNDPRQTIAVPGRHDVPKTQNARRIMQYQRQIKHWLDDEEAQLGQAISSGTTSRGVAAAAAAGSRGAARRQSVFAASGPATPATPAPVEAVSRPSTKPPPSLALHAGLSSDDDALLSIQDDMPPPLDPSELDALLAAPPLPYAASHAAPPPVGAPPPRRFCDNCGYWGSIRCGKCGARVCGLDCKDVHEATRCLKWA